MSVNHFPYLPIVTNLENHPCIQTVIWITTDQLFSGPLPTFPENFLQIRVWKFLCKVANRQQANKQRRKHIVLGRGNKIDDQLQYSLPALPV